MSRNPWGPRPDPKKRVITVSVTAAQDDDFERMKAELDLPTDSAVVKRGLEMLHAALAAVPADGETEWEYGWAADESVRSTLIPKGPRILRDDMPETPEAIARFPKGARIRRIKAGPWLPIPEGSAAE